MCVPSSLLLSVTRALDVTCSRTKAFNCSYIGFACAADAAAHARAKLWPFQVRIVDVPKPEDYKLEFIVFGEQIRSKKL